MEEEKLEILEISEKWAEAIVSNDAERIGKFMADEWIIVGENGATTKKDFLSSVASGDVTHEKMQIVGEALIRLYNETAVLTARITNNGHYKGEPFSADEWTTDFFVKSDGRWLCVSSQITPAKD